MKKSNIIIFLPVFLSFIFFLSSGLYSAEYQSVPVLQFKFGEGAVINGLSSKEFPNRNGFSERQSASRKNPINEYLKRIQFVTLDNLTEQLCAKNVNHLLNTDKFYVKYPVADREDAAFYAGTYYFNHWTGFPLAGKGSGCEIVDASARRGQVPNGFDLPYRTVYSAEQQYKYYVKNYPDGRYLLPAMFGIAKCRIHQKDYDEAVVVYETALLAEMRKFGFYDKSVAHSAALELVRLGKKIGESLEISIRISRGAGGYEEVCYQMRQWKKAVQISIYDC